MALSKKQVESNVSNLLATWDADYATAGSRSPVRVYMPCEEGKMRERWNAK